MESLADADDFLVHARVEAKGTTELVPLYKSCRVNNLDKSNGVVNGAFGVLLNYNGCFAEVRLDSALIAVVPKIAWERPDGTFDMAFPMDIGYAVTVAETQGQTLEHPVAILPDAGVPAGGYVTVTRVRKVDDLYLYGRPTRIFFTPSESRKWKSLKSSSRSDSIGRRCACRWAAVLGRMFCFEFRGTWTLLPFQLVPAFWCPWNVSRISAEPQHECPTTKQVRSPAWCLHGLTDSMVSG